MSTSQRYFPASWILPRLDEFNSPFFTSEALHLQTCSACNHVQHPAAEVCVDCGATDFSFPEYAARGRISSYTIVHHAPHPSLRDAVPYNVIIVELDALPHVQIVGNLLDVEPQSVAIGLAVEGTWTEPLAQDGQADVRLLQWRALDGMAAG